MSPGSHHAPRPPCPWTLLVPRAPMPLGRAPTSALPLGVSPVMLLALGADTAPKAGLALALPCHLQREWHAQPGGLPGARRAAEPCRGAGVPGCRGAGGLTTSQAGCRACMGWQPQGSQPPDPPRLQKWGAQRSQLLPTTLGRQAQAPVPWSQAQVPAVQWETRVPRGSQLQPAGGRVMAWGSACTPCPGESLPAPGPSTPAWP